MGPPLLLWQWLVERRNDRRALFLARPRLVFLDGGARGDRLRLVERQAGGDALHLLGVEHLALEQRLGHLDEDRLVLGEELVRAVIRVGHEALHFLIDLERGVLAVVLVLRDLAAEEDLLFLLSEGERTHRVAHAPLADHPAGELGRALEVVAGAGGEAVHRDLFGDAAAEENRNLIAQIVPRVVVLLVGRQLLREAERHAARDDRHLVNGIRKREEHREQRVTRFVDRGDALLRVADDHRAALGAHQHLVLRELEVVHPHDLLVVAGRVQCRLVHQVREIGAREAGRAAREHRHFHVIRHRNLAGVDGENALSALHVRTVDDNASIEAARTQERGIEHVGTVRRRHEDDAFVRLEAVHLDEQLIERLFALVVTAAEAGAAMAADGIDLVDEHDARRVLLPLLEQVAHARRADADEHLDEIRSADREERDVRLAGNRAGQQCLAGSRRAHQEDALRNAPAKFLELLRLLEELDDFLELFLRFVDAGDVLERHFLLRTRRELRLALAERQRLVAAALHLPHEEDPEADHEQDRRPRIEQRRPRTRGWLLRRHLHAAIDQLVGEAFVLRRYVEVERIAGLQVAADVLAGDDDTADLTTIGRRDKFAERNGFLVVLKLRGKIPDQNAHNDEHHPEQQTLQGRVQTEPPNRGYPQTLANRYPLRDHDSQRASDDDSRAATTERPAEKPGETRR